MKPVFEYEDYRDFLKDRIEELIHSDSKKLTHRALVKKMGYKSPSAINNIMKGKQNLSEESIKRFSHALALNKDESNFFRNLVLFNQAVSGEERAYFAGRIFQSKGFQKSHRLAQSQYTFYTHWYYVAIHEIISLPVFQEDPNWIAQFFGNVITSADAKCALETLLELGLIKRNSDGKLITTTPHVAAEDEVPNALLKTLIAPFHQEMIKMAGKSIETVSREMREIASLTLTLSLEEMDKYKELIQRFRIEFLALTEATKSKHKSVYQLQLQLFPLGSDEFPMEKTQKTSEES